jgi:flagellar FliL protein
MERSVATAKANRANNEASVGAEAGEAQEAPKKPKWIVWLALGLVAVAGGGGFWFWQSSSQATTDVAAKPEVALPLQFFSMDPPFVANFDGTQQYRFLQVTVRIATRSPDLMLLLRNNEPVLRNDLLMLFSNQQATVLASVEGKEALREDATRVVRDSIASLDGDPTQVERVLFTSLVMQ